MTTTEREFIDAVSHVTDEIDDSQNYLNRESISADDVMGLLCSIRDRLELVTENMIGD